jgi:7-keto-8-aminopelargonate synthetase-like enzyme
MQVEDRVAVRIGTLSKAVGTQGGFVAGPTELIEYLWNRSRPLIYSTGLSPAVCAAAAAALSIIADEPWRRERLHNLSRHLRSRLTERGIESPGIAECPIVPVILHDPQAAVQIAAKLERRGFLVGAIRPPTVPRDTSRLRIVVSCVHDETHLAELAAAIGDELTAAGLTGVYSVQKSSSSTT